MRCLVDADVFAYSCGFATQKTVYFTDEPEIVAEPVENALNMCKTALQSIYAEVDTWLRSAGESLESLELFLTGKDNFRDRIATIREYKGQRKNKPKPVHYQAIRDYMCTQWYTKVSEGHEADDELAITAHSLRYDPDQVMICSVDKDLKTVPGLLYSIKRKESELISPQEALVNFYRQCIVGDSSDNVIGCYKAGMKRASNITEDMSEHQMWNEVCDQFAESAARAKCPYEYPGYKAALETAQLLWLLREPGKIWSPPI